MLGSIVSLSMFVLVLYSFVSGIIGLEEFKNPSVTSSDEYDPNPKVNTSYRLRNTL
jgi:hypothetical protein